MENFKIFLEFKNGVIFTDDSKILPLISTVRSIVEPIILERRLSGKIRIEKLNSKATITYIGVRPFKYVPELMQAIRRSSSAENFG